MDKLGRAKLSHHSVAGKSIVHIEQVDEPSINEKNSVGAFVDLSGPIPPEPQQSPLDMYSPNP